MTRILVISNFCSILPSSSEIDILIIEVIGSGAR